MRPARTRPILVALFLLALVGRAALVPAQEAPLTAGSDGVPVPKKTKHVQPVYPAEALAQGIRGIVILEIVVDARGKVASTSVLRSIPGLDGAAIAAANQWEYEPSKVAGKPVSVRVTVPITFSLALPTLTRQAGVPELRQGVMPVFPARASGNGAATAEVTLEADGRIAAAIPLAGEPAWSEALLAALKTWRFAPPPEDAVVSFRVEAEFVKARGSEPDTVRLRATGLQRSALLPESPAPVVAEPPPAVASDPPAPASAPEGGAASPEGAAASPADQAPAPSADAMPPAQAPEPPPAAAPDAPSPASPAQAPSAPPAPAIPATSVAPAAGGEPAAAAPTAVAEAAPATTPPPVEVITAPVAAPPPESGISAVRDVTLEPGVPELSRGRRPVPPPLARMSQTTGTVEVSFSVSAGGTTALQSASGPEQLRYAAEQTVATWVFRRSRADRAYLVALFTYTNDKASAVVRPQAPPAAARPSEPPAAPSPPVATPVEPPPPG